MYINNICVCIQVQVVLSLRYSVSLCDVLHNHVLSIIAYVVGDWLFFLEDNSVLHSYSHTTFTPRVVTFVWYVLCVSVCIT